MARGRASTKVKTITGRDHALIKQLSKTGISNSFQAKEHCGLSRDRLMKLEKSGYIKTSEHIVRGEVNLVIQLDKVGKEYCRQELGTTNLCSAQTNHLEHDIKLTEVYYRLDRETQDTWRHERELIQEYYDKNPDITEKITTCIDATVEINGEIIAIESMGDSYTSQVMQVKEEISRSLGCARMECV